MQLIKKITSVPMKWKIAGIVLVPIIGYLGSALTIILNSWLTFQEAARTGESVKFISQISDLTKELQIERGKSVVFLHSSNSIQQSYYQEQRLLVDAKKKDLVQKVKNFGSPEQKAAISEVFKKVEEIRKVVDSNSSASTVESGYTSVINSLIDAQNGTLEGSKSSQVSKIRSLISLEKARESAGLLQANISSILITDKPIDTTKIETLVFFDANIKSNLDPMALDIQRSDKTTIESFSKADHWVAKHDLSELILSLSAEGAYGEDSQDSFNTLAKVKDDIGSLIESQIKHLESQVRAEHSGAVWNLIWNIVGVIILLSFMCGMLAIFLRNFEKNVQDVISGLKEANASLTRSSKKIRSSGSELTTSSHEASSAVQQTVSSMSEMKSMVARSDEKVKAASESSSQVSDRVREGEKNLDDLLKSMHEISGATERLDEINEAIDSIASRTSVINDIVFKTQLLSFNASIEAAKAGEHGRGFAVVAEEVGKLADMSGESAEEISNLLNESKKKIASSIKTNQELIKEGLGKSDTVNLAFKNIAKDVTEIDSNTSEVGKASNEQRLGIEQVTSAINQIDESIQENVSRAQESENLATHLIEDNQRLNSATSKLLFLVYGDSNLKISNEKKPPAPTNMEKSHEADRQDHVSDDNEIDADDKSFHPAA